MKSKEGKLEEKAKEAWVLIRSMIDVSSPVAVGFWVIFWYQLSAGFQIHQLQCEMIIFWDQYFCEGSNNIFNYRVLFAVKKFSQLSAAFLSYKRGLGMVLMRTREERRTGQEYVKHVSIQFIDVRLMSTFIYQSHTWWHACGLDTLLVQILIKYRPGMFVHHHSWLSGYRKLC